MALRSKTHGQGGFITLEAIGTTLFYLIMVATTATVVSGVMRSGGLAKAENAASMIRSNVQYVSVAAGTDYTGFGTAGNPGATLAPLAPGVVLNGAGPGQGTIPGFNGKIALTSVLASSAGGAADPTMFQLAFTGITTSECQKLALFGFNSWNAVYTAPDTTIASPVWVKMTTSGTPFALGSCDGANAINGVALQSK